MVSVQPGPSQEPTLLEGRPSCTGVPCTGLSPGFQVLTKEKAGVGTGQPQAGADTQVTVHLVPTAALQGTCRQSSFLLTRRSLTLRGPWESRLTGSLSVYHSPKQNMAVPAAMGASPSGPHRNGDGKNGVQVSSWQESCPERCLTCLLASVSLDPARLLEETL